MEGQALPQWLAIIALLCLGWFFSTLWSPLKNDPPQKKSRSPLSDGVKIAHVYFSSSHVHTDGFFTNFPPENVLHPHSEACEIYALSLLGVRSISLTVQGWYAGGTLIGA